MADYDLGWMKDRVYDFLRDSNHQLVPEESVQAWINFAQRDIAWRQRISHETETGVTSGSTIDLPGDFVELDYLQVASSGIDDDTVIIVDDTEWNTYSEAGGWPDGTLGRIFEGVIELYPSPSTGTAYTLRYVKEPADLTADSQTSTLPKPHIWKMIHYATAQGFYALGQDSDGDRYYTMYESGMGPMNYVGPNGQAGPIRLRPRPNYFETSEYLA